MLSRSLELARIQEDHVELLAPVLFSKDRDVLLVQSPAVLDAAVNLPRNHPELSVVRITSSSRNGGPGPCAHIW